MFGKKYKMENTRSSKRLRAGYLMKYELVGPEYLSQEPGVSNVKDVSACGLKFWSEQYIEPGTLMHVSVCVPPIEKNVQALSRVVRVRKAAHGGVYYIAVRFLEIAEDDQIVLDDFIESLAQNRRFVDNQKIVTRRPIPEPILHD